MRKVARPWSPSLVDIERMTAIFLPNLATLGRCSPIFRPGAEVWISLYGPPLAWPGLRSHRSMVLGPPFIQRRMTAFLRCGCFAASAAKVSIQPETEQAATPAADSLSHSRRDRRGVSVVLRAIVRSPRILARSASEGSLRPSLALRAKRGQ